MAQLHPPRLRAGAPLVAVLVLLASHAVSALAASSPPCPVERIRNDFATFAAEYAHDPSPEGLIALQYKLGEWIASCPNATGREGADSPADTPRQNRQEGQPSMPSMDGEVPASILSSVGVAGLPDMMAQAIPFCPGAGGQFGFGWSWELYVPGLANVVVMDSASGYWGGDEETGMTSGYAQGAYGFVWAPVNQYGVIRFLAYTGPAFTTVDHLCHTQWGFAPMPIGAHISGKGTIIDEVGLKLKGYGTLCTLPC